MIKYGSMKVMRETTTNSYNGKNRNALFGISHLRCCWFFFLFGLVFVLFFIVYVLKILILSCRLDSILQSFCFILYGPRSDWFRGFCINVLGHFQRTNIHFKRKNIELGCWGQNYEADIFMEFWLKIYVVYII